MPKLREIQQIPMGLRVTHSPNPVAASRSGPNGNAISWIYETAVEAIDKELTIIEFGAFVKRWGIWRFSTYTGEHFSEEDFAEWYSCAGAVLRPGTPAKDPRNWTGGGRLRASRVIWYFIAIDGDGMRFRGDAAIEHLAELDAE